MGIRQAKSSLLEYGLSKFKNIIDNTTGSNSYPTEAKFAAVSTIVSHTLEEVKKMNSAQKEITNNNDYV